MKKYFIALWLLAVCASGLALWTAINGSPFYLILARDQISRYLSKNYGGLLTLGEVSYAGDGSYDALEYDDTDSTYEFGYYPDADMVRDGYHEATILVMRQLIKNKLRSEIKANTGLSVSVADILVDVDAPMYVYHVGSVGSGYDCTSRINIKINDCGSKPEFAHVAYDVLRVLESANIGVEYVRIYDRMYSVAITTDISPADAAAMLQRVKNYVG